MNIYMIKIELQKVEIEKLKAKFEQKDIAGQRLKNQILDLRNQIDTLLRQKAMRRPRVVMRPDEIIAGLKAEIQGLMRGKASRETMVEARDEAILKLKADLQEKGGETTVQKIQLEDLTTKIAEMEAQLVDRDDKIAESEKHKITRAKEYRTLFARNDEKDSIIEDKTFRLKRMDTEVCRRADAYRCLDEKFKRVQDNLNHELEMMKRNTGATIDSLVSQVGRLEEDKKNLISELRVTNTNCDILIGKLQTKVKDLDSRLGHLRVAYQHLDNEYNSVKAKLAATLRRGVYCDPKATRKIADLETACGHLSSNLTSAVARVKGWQDASIVNINKLAVAKGCIKARDSEILTLTGEIHSLKTQRNEQQRAWRLNPKIAERNTKVTDLEARLAGSRAAREADGRRITELVLKCGNLRYDYNSAENKIRELDDAIIELRQEVAVKEIEIEELKLQVKKYRTAACYSGVYGEDWKDNVRLGW